MSAWDDPITHIRELEAEVSRLRKEAADWKARRDAAVEQCRHLHQEGKTREQWHLDNCGAMRAVDRARKLAEEWLDAGVVEDGNYPADNAVATEDMCARVLLAALEVR